MGNETSLTGPRNELREQYGQLQMQLRQLKEIYDDIYSSVVQGTATEYLRCKNHFILRRKHDIKDMIEGCIDDSVMLKFRQLSTSENQHKENNPPRGLLAAARQYAEAIEEVRVFEEIQSEVEHLNTEELQRQIRITNNELSEMKRKFERLYQELISLKEGYEASNQMFISLRRYSERKRILKAFITQNTDAFPGSLVPLSGD